MKIIVIDGQLATADCRQCNGTLSKPLLGYLCKHCRMPYCSLECYLNHLKLSDCMAKLKYTTNLPSDNVVAFGDMASS